MSRKRMAFRARSARAIHSVSVPRPCTTSLRPIHGYELQSVTVHLTSADALKVFDAGMKRVARYVLQPAYPDQTGFELFANGDFGFVAGGVRTLKTHA